MFSSLVRFFRERFGKQQRNPRSTDAEPHEETELESGDTLLPADTGNGGGVVPFDETLLERCRIMWQSGDWEGVKALGGVSACCGGSGVDEAGLGAC